MKEWSSKDVTNDRNRLPPAKALYPRATSLEWTNTFAFKYEPPHDKFNKMTVLPEKTQISLGIRPVWWESSLCAQ